MRILIFKRPKDSQLYKGLAVAFPGDKGWEEGKIEEVAEQDSVTLYNVGGALYAASELRFLDNEKP